jgi:hypothetical protein
MSLALLSPLPSTMSQWNKGPLQSIILFPNGIKFAAFSLAIAYTSEHVVQATMYLSRLDEAAALRGNTLISI